MTVVIPPLKGHFSWFLVSNIFCNPLFRKSTHHPFFSYPKTHFFHSLRRITFVFVCSSVCGRIFWTFIIRDGKNGFSTSVFFSNTFIYVMRNTAVFFCTRIVQIPVPRTVSLSVLQFRMITRMRKSRFRISSDRPPFLWWLHYTTFFCQRQYGKL
jgi:hypothetical protein